MDDIMSHAITDEESRQLREAEIERRRSARWKRHRHWFVKGPFPWHQFCRVVKLPGEALAVWMLIHHRLSRSSGKRVWATLPPELLTEVGLNRFSKDRAVRALERAGLLRVERQPGRATRIALEVETA